MRYGSKDMSVPFKAGARKHFPKAKIIFDKFHVLNVLSVQLDKVRASFLFLSLTVERRFFSKLNGRKRV
ncbi:transposase [Petrotoga sp. DB-2]